MTLIEQSIRQIALCFLLFSKILLTKLTLHLLERSVSEEVSNSRFFEYFCTLSSFDTDVVGGGIWKILHTTPLQYSIKSEKKTQQNDGKLLPFANLFITPISVDS